MPLLVVDEPEATILTRLPGQLWKQQRQALDAVGAKNSRGFLPKLYNQYGFWDVITGDVQLIEEFYLQERTVQELNDLKDLMIQVVL